ncbi:uncharacterized protein LOC126591500 isoform X2 [Malus sylvestris]|uniref:uncharacterized protein isoform X2 n=1 Tax=Malus domestica TaxID=3750 RepID=UPI0010AA1C1A|nr:uncharacterized protein LOC103447029 isoform X2 [Malus domestica]XP_050113157.1 uncharacterized protein LOC126591500 isoform X2 [Malus sylvestris]
MQPLAKLSKNLPRPLFLLAPRTLTTLTSSSSSLSHSLTSPGCDSTITRSTNTCFTGRTLLRSPWSAIQQRGAVVHGADVKPGNVIARNDRIYQVLKADHSHEGRGKAVVKVEVRDVDSGNKTSLRLLTDEQIDNRDGIVVLIDPDTLDQLDVPEDLFGKKAKYLQEEMKVTVELYNDKPLSVKVPKHVTCVVKEAQNPVRGTAQAPKEILGVMENGFTVKVPPHIVEGEAVVVDTDDDSYVKRAKP